MILWWGKKKQPDPKTGETPIEPLKPGETPASPIASLDQQIFGNAPIAASLTWATTRSVCARRRSASRPNVPPRRQRAKRLSFTSSARG